MLQNIIQNFMALSEMQLTLQNLGKSSKSSYQMDVRNKNEAIQEVAMDINEGADIIMIKPALAYLDVIHVIKETFKIPTFAYQVSGEFSMLKMQ